MHPILTVTLNPSIDLATSVDQVVAGPKLRCAAPKIDPGGGGVNVARAITNLSGGVIALVVVGGTTGEQLLELLHDEGVPTLPVPVSSTTRQSFAVTDASSGEQYRFGVPGAPLGTDDKTRILDQIATATVKDALVVISGSQPPGLPDDFITEIAKAVAPQNARIIVDTSGPALTSLVSQPQTPIHLLRIDQKEAEQAAGRPLNDISDSVDFATSLIERGVANHVVTGRGAGGSLAVSRTDAFFCTAPDVPIQSKIGAGDAFVGALSFQLSQNAPLDQALRWGVAAASGTVMTQGTTLCSLKQAESLLDQCIVSHF